MVTIEVLLTNKLQNREINLERNAFKVVTVEGDMFAVSNFNIPLSNVSSNVFLNTAIPIKCSFSFGPILPTNKYIKLFNLPYSVIVNPMDWSQNKKGSNEYRDLQIDWK